MQLEALWQVTHEWVLAVVGGSGVSVVGHEFLVH